MDAVALAATIGGSVVAVASVAGNVVIARMQRRQAVELAEKQQRHERHLARGDRLYERRAPVYEAMMRVVQPALEYVEARVPVMTETILEPPERLDGPSRDDHRKLQVRLRTYGSLQVGDAYDRLVRRIHRFDMIAAAYERGLPTLPAARIEYRSGAKAPQGETGLRQEVEDARQQVREAVAVLDRLVSEELGSL